MTPPNFTTYFEIDGERYDDYDEVVRLVCDCGKVAREVSAESQLAAWERSELIRRWHEKNVATYRKHEQEQQYLESPEGRAATARRDAEQFGNSKVTLSGAHDAPIKVLRAHSPEETNELKS